MKLGFAHVSGKYPDRSVQQDFLVYGIDQGASRGLTACKAWLGPAHAINYPNQAFGSPTSLVTLAQTAAFTTIFSDTRITDWYLGVWSFANGINNPWTVDLSQTQLANEYTEVYDLCVYLLTTYSSTNFTIQNWEGDWSLIGSFAEKDPIQSYRIDRMAAFYRIRQKAVNDARRAVPLSTSRISHAVEVNRVLDKFAARVHRDVIPYVNPDKISLSAYEAINTWGTGQVDAENNIEILLNRVIDQVRFFNNTHTPIYIGEMFWPEIEPGFTSLGLDAGDLLTKAIDVGTARGLEALIGWNIFDNEEQSPGVPRGYFIIKPDGNLSVQGTRLIASL